MRFLLDTNIVSNLIRDPQGRIAERIKIYGSILTQLESAGTPIGGNDLIIAAQAVSLDLTLVSDNEREFARVAGLRLENWLKDY